MESYTTISTFEELVNILKSPNFSVDTIKDNYFFPESLIHEISTKKENIITLINHIMELPEETISDLVDLKTVPYKEGFIANLIDPLLNNYYFLLLAAKKNYTSLAEKILKREFYINLFLKRLLNQKSPSWWSILWPFLKENALISSISVSWASQVFSDFAFEIIKFLDKERLEQLIPVVINKKGYLFFYSLLQNPNLSREWQIKVKKQIVNSFIKEKKPDVSLFKMDIDFTEVLPLLKVDKCEIFLRKLKENLFKIHLLDIDKVQVKIDFSIIPKFTNMLVICSPAILLDIQAISNFFKYVPLISFYRDKIRENQEELITLLTDFLWEKAQNLPKDSFKETGQCFFKLFFTQKFYPFVPVRECLTEFTDNPLIITLLEEFKLYIEEKNQ